MRTWQAIHSWSSLLCTLFLLMLCLTGLPLIFADEIEVATGTQAALPAISAQAAPVSVDAIVATAHARYPGEFLRFMTWDRDEPRRLTLNMATTPDAPAAAGHTLEFDDASGILLDEQPRKTGFLQFALRLHQTLFMGLAGELLLGVMGLLFVLAIVSGVVLYGPFMRKLSFGAIRRQRALRIRMLDLHNLLGICITAWLLVVGATGVVNTLSTPLFALWSAHELPHLMQSGQNTAPLRHMASVDEVIGNTKAALPGRRVSGVVFPNAHFGSAHHYLLWTLGNTPITSRMFQPVLLDGESGRVLYASVLPWYLRVLEISRPFHFGDYGGFPLKILWAVLDLMTIVILIGGLYLWVRRVVRSAATGVGGHAPPPNT
ncbi:PepSY-associated TM helix domain-containing protein [Herbaspirillum chlorophenolicum]|uniref:PepSY-associated TM helix domain-containing protein n=1 Tax=Herbaspirillum chlorophenolicum TaxID=211589 RepID=UPI00067ACD86|nr:PepSY domain-containing protein [Herbaspirillum chlorophenolicum]